MIMPTYREFMDLWERDKQIEKQDDCDFLADIVEQTATAHSKAIQSETETEPEMSVPLAKEGKG